MCQRLLRGARLSLAYLMLGLIALLFLPLYLMALSANLPLHLAKRIAREEDDDVISLGDKYGLVHGGVLMLDDKYPTVVFEFVNTGDMIWACYERRHADAKCPPEVPVGKGASRAAAYQDWLDGYAEDGP